ncbi:L-alanine-DL-glutamate epimerase-like enolase superfamily enzyme [Kribbella amoyensis]|uniref:L-alanine-DL-glutamate epimerase-like enolase superfamily enzyme n=1 Tax=Kribbella amoyensis TaxID=996641 RepID=A0A561BSF3_9ACTN|nr:enolase C-terminal domain-like protein [Kribbella amoyensis]TWD81749.1 L-alanine-DL-glutamate epimerase-like enolase superfamily enzyme [Kribbella amoyensis]
MALSEHVVSGISTAQVGAEYVREVGRNSFRGHHGRGGTETVYVVETDRGVTGWGLPLGPGDPAALIGRNLAELIDPAVGVVDPGAVFLDYPLHDLAARVLGVPVYAMLGATGDPRVRAYSGGIYLDDLDPADAPAGLTAIKANLAQDHELGFRDFKLKLGRGYRWMPSQAGLERDIEVTRLTRELYPDAEILVDPNDGFTVNALVEYLAAVTDCRLYWLEEVFAERYEDYRFLREHLGTLSWQPKIADGEFDPDDAYILRLAQDGLLDIALMDVTGYGLTAWRHLMPKLVEASTEASPHAWGFPLKSLYAAHLAAGLGNIPLVEGVPGHTLGTDGDGYELADGHFTLSDRPGFGIELAG